MDLNEFLKVEDIEQDIFKTAIKNSIWALSGGGTETIETQEFFNNVSVACYNNLLLRARGRYLDVKKDDSEKDNKIKYIVYDSFYSMPNAPALFLLLERINKAVKIENVNEFLTETETATGSTTAHADETTGGTRESTTSTTEKYNPVAAASSYTGGTTDGTGSETTTAENTRDNTATNEGKTARRKPFDVLYKDISELKNFLAEYALKFTSAYTYSAWQLEELYYYF